MTSHRRSDDPIDDPRRRFLLRALAAGFLTGGSGWNLPALASVLGKLPGVLPEGKSVFEIKGDVLINGAPATKLSAVKPGDSIRTGADAQLVCVVGADAFLVREDTELEIGGVTGAAARHLFRIITGAALAVIGPKREPVHVNTPLAIIGIRGTGLYTAVDPDKSYICTCYGKTQIESTADPVATEAIESQHHDAARYVLAKADQGRRIVPAPFIDHTDLELMTLEALVGRKVPFGVSDTGEYLGPRRDY
jgi:hypothetical protein